MLLPRYRLLVHHPPVIYFFEARCMKKPAVKNASYFRTHRSLILNWIICHRGRMHCNKLNNGLFYDVATKVVDREDSTAYY